MTFNNLARTITVLFALVLLSLSLAGFARAQRTTADILDELGSYPCPNSDFTCVTLTVPLDHLNPDNGETLEVVFGVLPATGERKGMFVTATGGPGSAGLASADSYTAGFDPSIPEHFDIVFFDQRGAYQSGNLQCPNAVTTWYLADWRADTAAREEALTEAARTFAEDCIQETGVDPDTLKYYGTAQAIEDLEFFRQQIGDDQLWLYGESYGTQYVQQYTVAHPDNVAGLIVDGTVDTTLSLTDFLAEQSIAFNTVLEDTLKGCTFDDTCSADAGQDALQFYDDLATQLELSPATVNFGLPSSATVERSFARTDLETVAAGYMYSTSSRMLFQRSLAAAAQGDLRPLLRMAYIELGIDPETGFVNSAASEDYSDALYYAVECSDYGLGEGNAEARAEAYLRAGDVIDQSNPRFAPIFYGDLPCAFWPSDPPAERPAALIAKGIPTLVLGATADPATPVQNGERVFANLDDGYLITTEGGAHVIFGRGDSCPDDLVTNFLVDDLRPAQRETICEGVVADDYVSLAALDARAFENPLQALDAAYTEIYYAPEYYYWDQETLTLLACPFGGTLSFAPSLSGDQFHLSDCSFSNGFVMTGSGAYDYESGEFTLDVAVTGIQEGLLTYTQDADGNIKVEGLYGGREVDLADVTQGTS